MYFVDSLTDRPVANYCGTYPSPSEFSSHCEDYALNVATERRPAVGCRPHCAAGSGESSNHRVPNAATASRRSPLIAEPWFSMIKFNLSSWNLKLDILRNAQLKSQFFKLWCVTFSSQWFLEHLKLLYLNTLSCVYEFRECSGICVVWSIMGTYWNMYI